MNLKRGFKRITNVLGVVLAIACGGTAVYLPIQWRNDAGEMSLEKMVDVQHSAEDSLATDYHMSRDDFRKLMKVGGKLPDGKPIVKEVMSLTLRWCENHKRNISFWYRLSKAELVGLVSLFGLGGVVAGYALPWILYMFIYWLVLGFADKNTKGKSGQQA